MCHAHSTFSSGTIEQEQRSPQQNTVQLLPAFPGAFRERADTVYLYWQHDRALPRGWSTAVARRPHPPETHLDGDLMGPWLLGSQPECRPLLMVSPRRHIPSSENWSRHAGSCLSSFHSMWRVWYEGERLISPSQPPALITSFTSKPQLNEIRSDVINTKQPLVIKGMT